MVTAVFTDNDDYARAYGLWQWDYGQQLRIEGLHLPTAVEIHFALQETGGEAIPRVGTTKDGITTVTIPDSMLEGNSTAWTADKAYNIYAWVYLSDKLSGETIKRITMQVKSRPKPEAFEAPGDGEIFHEAIEAVNDAAKRAEEAGDKAVSAADEAKAAATQTAEHLQVVQGLAEQVETNADTVAQDKQAVTGMLSQAQQEASDAALSAQAAKLSETAAAQAQTGAETAEDTARQYAEETEADRQAVANDRQAVSQMREAVAADRQAVEQTAAQFGQTSQDALTAIGQAQSTAVGAVKAEGNKQTTAVQEAGTQAVSEVTEAKTTAVEAVTTEGDTQTKRVEDAAAGIVADREQISQNKTDIAGLVEGMTDLAPAIHNAASGSVITANDAAEGRPFRGLRVLGRTEQVRTTGKNLLDIERYFALGYDKYYNTVANLKNGIITVTNQNDSNGSVSFKDLGELNIYPPFTLSAKVNKTNCYVKVIGINNEGQHTAIYNITNTIKSVFVDRKDNVAKYIVQLLTTVENSDFEVSDIQIESGETATSYEPYTGGKPSPSPEYPQEIVSAGDGGSIEVEVTGKNLVDILEIKAGTKDTQKKCNIYGDVVFSCISENVISEKDVWLIRLDFKNGEAAHISTGKMLLNPKIKVSADNPIIAYYYRSSYVTSGRYTNIQLEYGNTPTRYEPYTCQSLTLSTLNGLPGVPVSKDGNYTDADGQQWVCDEVDLERGKYVQRIETRILDGTEAWKHRITNSGNNNFQILINDRPSSAIHRSFCNYLPYKNFIWDDNIVNLPKIYSYDLEITASFPPESEFKSVEIWNSWLKEKGDFKFQYVLDTPIERDLTPEEISAYKALRTYGPTTVITNDAGAGMEVTYVADTKAYIDKKFKELNQAIVNTQIALL